MLERIEDISFTCFFFSAPTKCYNAICRSTDPPCSSTHPPLLHFASEPHPTCCRHLFFLFFAESKTIETRRCQRHKPKNTLEACRQRSNKKSLVGLQHLRHFDTNWQNSHFVRRQHAPLKSSICLSAIAFNGSFGLQQENLACHCPQTTVLLFKCCYCLTGIVCREVVDADDMAFIFDLCSF